MDNDSARLISGLIEGHLARARGWLKEFADEPGRGRHLLGLVEQQLATSEDELEALMLQLEVDDAPSEFTVRGLERLLHELEVILPGLLPFLRDIQRHDLPAGLHVAIDATIEQMLPYGGDPIIHMDDEYMYSTLDLRRALNQADSQTTGPIVFFLPSTDPFNVLLLPILAHEVGHAAIRQADLGSKTVDLAIGDLNRLLKTYVDETGDSNPRDIQVRLLRWLEELLCDALATVLSGPAYLFASVAFLPVTAGGDVVGTHPFPKDRVGLMLDYLETLGWTATLERIAPNTVQWLRESVDSDTEVEEPAERFLRDACATLKDHLISVAVDHAISPLTPEPYNDIAPEATKRLELGIPPTEAGAAPASAWYIVLIGWERAFSKHGDSASSIAHAVNDVQLSRSLLWGIERSRIAELWVSSTEED